MNRATGSLVAARYRDPRTRRVVVGSLFASACLVATLSGIVVLAVLLGSVVSTALNRPPARPWYDIPGGIVDLMGLLSQLTTQFPSSDPMNAGFRAGVFGSIWLLGLVAVIGLPIGIGAAVFLEEYARPGVLRGWVQTNIANLAGVPSIVYGILGLALFVRAFGNKSLALGPTLVAGGLTLSLLVLPTVVIATQEALRAVPSSLRQAALALGATRWQMIRGHVLPSALPGILTGTILALSRAIGETAPLLMVGASGAIDWIPSGPADYYTALPVEIYNYAKRPIGTGFETVAAGGILILVVLLLSMNAVAIFIRNHYGRALGRP